MAKLPGMGSVELAFWYHDICYDTRAKDNEERSAELARIRLLALGLDHGYVNQVVALILATKHEHEPRTREARVLLDVDLSILGAPPEEYDAYEANIRREYVWVPEEAFRAGRAAILKRFLNRQWVFYTQELRSGPFEGLAVANLSRALAALGH